MKLLRYLGVGGVIFFSIFIVGMVLIALLAFSDASTRDSCSAAGGVPVKSHLGALYCFDKNALLKGWPNPSDAT